ncbi:3'-tRNA processing endoribonuclease [Aureococcus anophagefferens]|nr:3'-tRNA processing endoribonuclease [Aureococcus anophagefferens]KAH8061905.1 3'-tRNA processing endoribonuclease [Aureococcus anophagefferens]KAH8082933.1 3'-tRNA processing endoribonuclease [Aureococcus anophagefferens]KAH8086025.1 3'-tRNA processing endoribonuclease [Aureococcus anophagefferens]
MADTQQQPGVTDGIADEDLLKQLGVKYVCGDCGAENIIKARDAVRCRFCGYRILYKVRTKRLIQFEAR